MSAEHDPQLPEPQENPRKNIFERGVEHVRDWWEREERPGILQFHYYYIPVALAGTLALGGEVAGVVDDLFDTHLTDGMANVRVMPDSGWLTRFGQSYVQCMGLEGGGESPYKCHIDDFLYKGNYPGDHI